MCVHVCVCVCVCVKLLHLLWTVAHQAPLSMGFSKQKYWSGLLGPPPGDLPDPGIEPVSLMSLALPGGFFTTSATWEVQEINIVPTCWATVRAKRNREYKTSSPSPST